MRQCLFCGNSANTAEDVWPKWILEKLKGKRHAIKGFIEKKQIEYGGSNPRLTIKCVCDQCNNGWMSRLEDANKRTVGILMHDISCPLDHLQQRTIAAWALKTSMVMEFVEKIDSYTKDERENLRTSSGLPTHTIVWLGRYVGSDNLGIYGNKFWDGDPSDPRSIYGFGTTILIGHLVIQTLTIRRQQNYGAVKIKMNPGPWSSLLIKVWPGDLTVTWPPRLTFTDGSRGPYTLKSLIQRWVLNNSISV